jgi:chemotaxis protein CheD
MASGDRIMLELGQMSSSARQGTVYSVSSIGTGVVVVVYDPQNLVGGVACVSMPESKLSMQSPLEEQPKDKPAKFADIAIPLLLEEFKALGGDKNNSTVRLVGGAQLFNFGGGGGNLLNIGVRNAMAIRTALTKEGFVVEKADTGGNKPRSIRFELNTGNVYVRFIGATEDYVL